MAGRRVEWQRLLPEMIKDDEGIPSMQGGPVLYRTKAPGGWIIATGKGEGAGITFVPNADHAWTIGKKKKKK